MNNETTATLNVSYQEAISKIYRTLKTQGQPAIENDRCRYTTVNGLHCAVGALIPEDLYHPDMEGQSIDNLGLFSADLTMKILSPLMKAHDVKWKYGGTFNNVMLPVFRTLALRHRLGLPDHCILLDVDAWRDPDGGWQWNSWHYGTIVPRKVLDMNTRKLLQYLRNKGYLMRSTAGHVAVEDDGYNLVITERSTGMPFLAIEYGSEI